MEHRDKLLTWRNFMENYPNHGSPLIAAAFSRTGNYLTIVISYEHSSLLQTFGQIQP